MQELLEIVKLMLHPYERVYVVLDALDENRPRRNQELGYGLSEYSHH